MTVEVLQHSVVRDRWNLRTRHMGNGFFVGVVRR